MDLSQITPHSQRVDILTPHGEPTGLVMWLRPQTSPEIRAVQRRFQNAALKGRRVTMTADQIEANQMDLLVACIERWEWGGDAKFEGEKPALTAETARAVLGIKWIRDQVDTAAGDDAAFFTMPSQPPVTK